MSYKLCGIILSILISGIMTSITIAASEEKNPTKYDKDINILGFKIGETFKEIERKFLKKAAVNKNIMGVVSETEKNPLNNKKYNKKFSIRFFVDRQSLTSDDIFKAFLDDNNSDWNINDKVSLFFTDPNSGNRLYKISRHFYAQRSEVNKYTLIDTVISQLIEKFGAPPLTLTFSREIAAPTDLKTKGGGKMYWLFDNNGKLVLDDAKYSKYKDLRKVLLYSTETKTLTPGYEEVNPYPYPYRFDLDEKNDFTAVIIQINTKDVFVNEMLQEICASGFFNAAENKTKELMEKQINKRQETGANTKIDL